MVVEDQSSSSSSSVCVFQQFHSNHGNLVQLSEDRLSAFRLRPSHEFNQGLVFSSLPLRNDEVFEVRIDRKVHSWTGSLQIGVTTNDPSSLRPAPPNALDIVNKSWILSGCNLFENGKIIVEDYGPDLDELDEGDRVGVMRTSEGDLVLYVNSFAQGVAVTGLPESVYACVDLYGKCVQITAVVNNDTKNASARPLLTLNTSVISNNMGLLNSVDSNQEEEDRAGSGAASCVSTPGSLSSVGTVDRLRFHHRCGTMVKLSAGQRTGERRRPLDEFNNGVVMTQRPLLPDELFEIRIDSLVDKWSGSIEVGITTHNPQALDFPSTMTNLRSGTIMMSGCGILTNGKGTRREYGQCNLDELAVGDRIGLIRYTSGELHFFVNSRDQGIAASNVPNPVWGVVDLYGRTVKVSLVDREDVANKPPSEIAEGPEDESDQDLMTMTSSAMSATSVLAQDRISPQDPLLFYPRCGAHAAVVNSGLTAHRPNAQSDFNHGVVLTNRPLKADELFEVMLDRIVLKWAGSIEIGVTTQQPEELDFPATMTNIRSGTWMMTGNGVMHNGLTVLDDYGTNLDRLGSGDRVGVQRRSNGALHFYVNGEDQGAVTGHVPERIYGVVDLYGQAAQVTIVDHTSVTPLTENSSPYPSYLYPAPATLAPLVSPSSLADSTYALPSNSLSPSNSSSSTLIHTDLSFHRLHGINTTLTNNNLTAFRPNALSEFNNAICVTSRPLLSGEMFEIVIEKLVERWSGSLELGVTAIRPENLDFPATMTDIDYETWMLSGSTVMQVGGDGTITRNGYPLDLDALQEGNKVGLLRHADGSLHYYLNSQDQGPACWNVPAEIYAVIDLYGQCAQVSLVHRPLIPMANTPNNQTNASLPPEVLVSTTKTSSVVHHHKLSSHHGRAITLLDNGKAAKRDDKDFENGLVFSAEPLQPDETFEVRIEAVSRRWSGSISIGLTTFQPRTDSSNPIPARIDNLPDSAWYVSGTDSMLIHQTLIGKVAEKKAIPLPSLAILERLQVGDSVSVSYQSSSLRFFVNGRDLGIPNIKLNAPLSGCYVVIELHGAIQSASVKSLAIVAPAIPESTVTSPAQTATQPSAGLPLSLSQLALREAVQGIQSALSSRFGAAFNAQQQLQQQRFHDHHGRNVLLKDNGLTAQRTDSYNQGLVFSKDPLVPGSQPFQIRIEQLDERWTGSIMLGVTAISPEKMSGSPTCALLLKRPSWIICGRSVHQGIGRRLTSDVGFDLNHLKAGQTAGLYINSTGHLCVVIDGKDRGPVAKVGLDQAFYAVVDLYGACLQASVVPVGQPTSVAQSDQPILAEEKALRETANSEKIFRASRSPKRRSCGYKSSCARFIRLIGLPETYLDAESFFCGCQQCFDETSNGSSPTDKSISELKGWCRWKIKKRKQMETVSTGAPPSTKKDGCNEKWQMAYHATKPAVVRRILDEGHLLPPELNIWQRTRAARNRSDKGHDGDSDGQMLFFSPSIQQPSSTPSSELFDPLTKKIQRGHVILQVLVQPGSYKVRRATSPQNGPAPATTVTAINSTAPVCPAVAGSAIVSEPVSTLNSSTALPPTGVVSAPAIGAADETNILWYTKERGAAVVQALLVRTEDDPMMPL